MDQEKVLKQILIEVQELKRMVAQLGPVGRKPTFKEELDAVEAQGLDLAEYIRQNG